MGALQSHTSTQQGMQALRAKMMQQKNRIGGIADEEKIKVKKVTTQKKKIQDTISFDILRKNISGGNLAEKTRKEKEAQLHMLLEHALFLNSDEPRRKRWMESISLLTDELLQNLLGAVIRENLRFKKGTRDLVVELNKKNAE